MPPCTSSKASPSDQLHAYGMKISAISLIAAALLAGAPALAQTPPMPTPDAATRRAFDQIRSRMENVHRTERAQVLGALSPAHRALLASIAGQLATSVAPDYNAAEKQLDSVLSANEAQSIISADRNARTQSRSIMDSMRSQLPAPPNTQHFRDRGFVHIEEAGAGRTPDAGRILLRVAMGGPGGMVMGFHAGGPPKP